MGGDQNNRRIFPRIDATCPVMHREHEAQRWSVGLLINFSATGLLFSSTRCLQTGSPISIKLERGRNKTLPALSGQGKVIRCEKKGTGKFEVACKLEKIDPPGKTEG